MKPCSRADINVYYFLILRIMPCVGQAAGVDQAGRKKEAPESIFYFCGKCLFFNSENTFLFGGTIYSM